MESKRESSCWTCAHLIKMEPDSSRLFPDRYGCEYHRLYDGEVIDPHWQGCPDHQSAISKLRSDRLGQLGI